MTYEREWPTGNEQGEEDRIVWGIAMFACLGFDAGQFGFSAFLAGAVINALPGIVLQIVLIPLVVIALQKVIRK